MNAVIKAAEATSEWEPHRGMDGKIQISVNYQHKDSGRMSLDTVNPERYLELYANKAFNFQQPGGPPRPSHNPTPEVLLAVLKKEQHVSEEVSKRFSPALDQALQEPAHAVRWRRRQELEPRVEEETEVPAPEPVALLDEEETEEESELPSEEKETPPWQKVSVKPTLQPKRITRQQPTLPVELKPSAPVELETLENRCKTAMLELHVTPTWRESTLLQRLHAVAAKLSVERWMAEGVIWGDSALRELISDVPEAPFVSTVKPKALETSKPKIKASPKPEDSIHGRGRTTHGEKVAVLFVAKEYLKSRGMPITGAALAREATKEGSDLSGKIKPQSLEVFISTSITTKEKEDLEL